MSPPLELPVGAAHPAGLGTAPERMVRRLAGVLDGEWEAMVIEPCSWQAETAGGRRHVRVDIDPRFREVTAWQVSGRLAGRIEVTVRAMWEPFGEADADRAMAALRAFGVLP